MPSRGEIAECRACLCLASRRAARAITRAFDRRLRRHGIRATQFSILTTLIGYGPATIGELADMLGIERTTLSRNLALIEAQGWVDVAVSDEDARSRVIAVTRKGRDAVRAALPAWRQAQAEAAAAIGDAGVSALHTLAGTSLQ